LEIIRVYQTLFRRKSAKNSIRRGAAEHAARGSGRTSASRKNLGQLALDRQRPQVLETGRPGSVSAIRDRGVQGGELAGRRSMSGYTPLFDSLTNGSLCGRWPDVGLWPVVLSLSDRYGVVDRTIDHIALVTGLPTEEVSACMKRFCEPDPRSRSRAKRGARLELLNPRHRDWGWRIVNYKKYADKARLRLKNAQEVANGKNRERMSHRRTKATAADRLRPTPQTQTQTVTLLASELARRKRTSDRRQI
jgi:hypothetical protein